MHRVVALLGLCACDQLFQLDRVAVPAPVDALSCPVSYSLTFATSHSRYRRITDEVQWPIAAALCAGDAPGQTHLAVIDGDAEYAELSATVTVDDMWIGLSDRVTNGTYLWVTAQDAPIAPLGTYPWAPDRPDDPGGAQDCIRVNPTSQNLLDDAECTNAFDFICECDGYADDPARY